MVSFHPGTLVNFFRNIHKAVEDVGTKGLIEGEDVNSWFRQVFSNVQENVTQPELPTDIDHIRIMSLHSSKGLSAKVVVLCSMIDDLIPFIKSGAGEEQIDHWVDENRRLFYVAVTRCKTTDDYAGRLIISSFTSIYGLDAVLMGIKADPKSYHKVQSTRYLKEFGTTSPPPILGDKLL